MVNENGVGITHVLRVTGVRYYNIEEYDEEASDQVHQFYNDTYTETLRDIAGLVNTAGKLRYLLLNVFKTAYCPPKNPVLAYAVFFTI